MKEKSQGQRGRPLGREATGFPERRPRFFEDGWLARPERARRAAEIFRGPPGRCAARVGKVALRTISDVGWNLSVVAESTGVCGAGISGGAAGESDRAKSGLEVTGCRVK